MLAFDWASKSLQVLAILPSLDFWFCAIHSICPSFLNYAWLLPALPMWIVLPSSRCTIRVHLLSRKNILRRACKVHLFLRIMDSSFNKRSPSVTSIFGEMVPKWTTTASNRRDTLILRITSGILRDGTSDCVRESHPCIYNKEKDSRGTNRNRIEYLLETTKSRFL